jgi:hypothetical protein
MNMVKRTICAFVLTVPENKKAKFMIIPKKAAAVVRHPKLPSQLDHPAVQSWWATFLEGIAVPNAEISAFW